jgi:FdhD protein
VVKVTRYKGVGEEAATVSNSEDTVIAEVELSILLNGRPVCRIQCSPHGLESLAAGHLLSEGYVRPGQRILRVVALPGASKAVDVKVAEVEDGVRQEDVVPRTAAGLQVTPDRVCESIEELLKKSPLFGLTGAAHAAALCSSETGILYWGEDISRHNAVDRVAGKCLMAKDSFGDKFLVITGRINGEMARKAAACGIGLVASKAPPTDQGVFLGERLGITIVGFVRNRRFNVYTYPHRLL